MWGGSGGLCCPPRGGRGRRLLDKGSALGVLQAALWWWGGSKGTQRAQGERSRVCSQTWKMSKRTSPGNLEALRHLQNNRSRLRVKPWACLERKEQGITATLWGVSREA